MLLVVLLLWLMVILSLVVGSPRGVNPRVLNFNIVVIEYQRRILVALVA